MKTVTEILSVEHQHILKVINSMINECDQLEAGMELDKSYFEKAIDFIKNYADKFHHAKEENILFEELNKDTVHMHCNPISQMLYEHDTGRNYVKGMEAGLNENDKNKVIENARGYAFLLQDHIYKEENILYQMADEALDNETQAAMLVKFRLAEEDKFPGGMKEKYLSVSKELEVSK